VKVGWKDDERHDEIDWHGSIALFTSSKKVWWIRAVLCKRISFTFYVRVFCFLSCCSKYRRDVTLPWGGALSNSKINMLYLRSALRRDHFAEIGLKAIPGNPSESRLKWSVLCRHVLSSLFRISPKLRCQNIYLSESSATLGSIQCFERWQLFCKENMQVNWNKSGLPSNAIFHELRYISLEQKVSY